MIRGCYPSWELLLLLLLLLLLVEQR